MRILERTEVPEAGIKLYVAETLAFNRGCHIGQGKGESWCDIKVKNKANKQTKNLAIVELLRGKYIRINS